MHEDITCIGLDVHKRTIAVAVRQPGDLETTHFRDGARSCGLDPRISE